MEIKGAVQQTGLTEITIGSETAKGPPKPCNVFSILASYSQRNSYLKIDLAQSFIKAG